MKERPIPFSADMVRAILEDRKGQTRRVIKNVFVHDGHDCVKDWDGLPSRLAWAAQMSNWEICPYGEPGDRLWVRETWAGDDLYGCVYRADHPNADISKGELDDGEQELRKWRSPRFMFRWASRITLELTDVRVQRVQDISEDDAKAEGVASRIAPGGDLAGAFSHVDTPIGYRNHFQDLWDSINAKRPGCSWNANPWCWALTFKRIEA